MAGCTETPYQEESGTVFHTLYHIKYQAARPLTDSIDAELQAFNLSLNPFIPQSVISKVNRNEPVEVDDWFETVFRTATEVSDRTGGAFDITCAPLVNLWGFGFQKMDSVTPQMVDSIRTFVGYRKMRLENRQVVKEDPRMMLNCSAIAKGFACDVVAQLLERNGVQNYMVEIGGEVTMRGVNAAGNGWRIGINKPEDETEGVHNGIQQIVQLNRAGAVATSGNYRNFYIKEGKKYAHTIDPRTGYPAEQQILSATIVADHCITADAYATAFMTLGLEKVRELAPSWKGIEYYLIYVDEEGRHQIEYSEGMKPFLRTASIP
ncbi:MAG: FAD:protein FMN transferase [Parabacteroides sp.]